MLKSTASNTNLATPLIADYPEVNVQFLQLLIGCLSDILQEYAADKSHLPGIREDLQH